LVVVIIIIIIIIIIFINCNWVDTRWQWLFYMYTKYDIDGGHAVAQLVEALRCKPEGRGLDS
jgi:hypothetical protein